MRRIVAFILVALVTGFAVAGEPDLETPKDVAKAMKKALRKNDANMRGATIGRARELKELHEPEELLPIVKAAAEGLKSTNSTVQSVMLELIADLAVPGTYEYVRPMLDIPKRLTGVGTRNVRARAIHVAAKLGGEDALPDIEKLLEHPDVKFSRSAARALVNYGELEPEAKAALLERLVTALSREERALKKRDEDVVARSKGMIEELNKTLATLSAKSGATTAEEWEALLAKQ